MRTPHLELPPEHVYPTDEWRIRETRYSDRYYPRTETAFSLSNGYVGMRGSFDEGRPALCPGTFINGFHETWRIVHAEEAYGLARTGQTIINVPDASVLRLFVDDEPLFIPTARLRRYARVLDMREGTLSRDLAWSTPSGKHVLVRSCRLVSFEHRHLIAIEYEVVLLDRAAPIVICSPVVDPRERNALASLRDGEAIDPRTATRLDHRVLNTEIAEADGVRLLLGCRASNSGMTLGMAVDHVIESDGPVETATSASDDRMELVLTAAAEPEVPIRITKLIAYHSSRSETPAELVNRCKWTLTRARRTDFASLRASQRAHLDHFWDRADVVVETGLDNSQRTQEAIRWNLFQLAQATLRAEGAGVPAKGLTGLGYEGHYFWDTEVFLLPFLSYTEPRIARNLLRFRHSMLPSARARAAELGQRGAMFPWRTINGEEASAYYQAGTAQYHLNADIAYAIRRYTHVSGDLGFLVEVGAEMLVETARLWADLGFYADGEFHIHGVTGPDEYTTVVNDNTYTNLMARLNLSSAASTLRRLEAERPDAYRALVDELRLDEAEIAEWERAAAAMHVPYDERRGIHPQDASFLDREVWDFEHTPPEHFPLLLHYHPLVIYRHQVIKQADIVLAMFLLGHEFTSAQKKANFDYYDALTTGDSSLSACVQAIVAAEVGEEKQALEYFAFALLMDLADVAGNASDGVHIASAAGVWQALVYGFGGVRDEGGELAFTPHLPGAWESLSFTLHFRDRRLRVRLSHDDELYRLEDGAPLSLVIRGREHIVAKDRPLRLRPPERSDSNGAAREPDALTDAAPVAS